ncbi:hypothetical protein BJX99DRAFT_32107 [Aspergillus californicus]
MSPEKKTPLRVVIIGGSITGLTLAHCLDKAGIDYIVLEQHHDILVSIGGAVALQPNGCRVLDQIGVFDELKLRTDLEDYSNTFPDGYTWHARSCASYAEGFGYPVTVTSRRNILDALYVSLEHQSKIMVGVKVTDISPSVSSDGPLTITTDNDTQYTADIVVGADGVHGITRSEMHRIADMQRPGLMPKDDPSNLTVDYLCLVGITDPIPADSAVARGLQPRRLYGVSYPGAYIMLAINGDSTVGWCVQVKTDRTYTHPHVPQWSHEDTRTKLEEISDYELCKSLKFRDIWQLTPSISCVPSQEGVLETWSFGRIACIGDNVFKLTPNLAQGANLCMESAATLANALHELITSNTENRKPTETVCHDTISKHLIPLKDRITNTCDESYKISRLQSLETPTDWFMARYINPHLTWLMYYVTWVSLRYAAVLSYVPLPERALVAGQRRDRVVRKWGVRIACGMLLGLYAICSLSLPLKISSQ